MHLRYGILADAVAGAGGQKLTIVGTFDVLYARSFPAVHPHLAIVLRIEAHATEAGEHQVTIEYVDAGYNTIGPPLTLPFSLRREDRPIKDAPLSAEMGFDLNGLPIPAEGNYEFAVKVDGRHIGSVPLYVRQAPK